MDVCDNCASHHQPRHHLLYVFLCFKFLFSRLMTYECISQLCPFVCYVLWKHVAFAGMVICVTVYTGYGGFASTLMLCFCVIALLRCLEHNLVYYSNEPSSSRLFVELPSKYHLPYEAVYIRSGRTKIHAFFIPAPRENRPTHPSTILYLHGNAGNIGHRLPNSVQLHHICRVNILLVEYRGFGKSNGTPSEHGLYEDARASLQYLFSRSDIDPNNIIVFGRSLGGAVAVHLASTSLGRSHLAGVILENTFTSLPAVGKKIFQLPCIDRIPDCCLLNRYNSLEKVRTFTLPVLFISGLMDNLVPPTMMTQMYENCKSRQKTMIRHPTGSHNSTWTVPRYYDSIIDFLSFLRTRPMEDAVMNESVILEM